MHIFTSFTAYFTLFHQGRFVFVSKNIFLVLFWIVITDGSIGMRSRSQEHVIPYFCALDRTMFNWAVLKHGVPASEWFCICDLPMYPFSILSFTDPSISPFTMQLLTVKLSLIALKILLLLIYLPEYPDNFQRIKIFASLQMAVLFIRVLF